MSRPRSCRQATFPASGWLARERVARRAGRKPRRVVDEARVQRQPRIERPPRDIHPGHHRLTRKAQRQPRHAEQRHAPRPGGSRRRLTQVAAATATAAAGRSPGLTPASTSQQAQKARSPRRRRRRRFMPSVAICMRHYVVWATP